MIKLSDLSITSLEEIMAFDVNGGAHKFTLDELQSATIANTQENTNLTGRAGRTIGVLQRNKSVTVSGANGMLSIGMIGADTGGKVQEDVVTNVKYYDYITAKKEDTAVIAETKYKAVGTTGNEIDKIYVKNATTGEIETILEQDATASKGKFTYDPATKKISFFAGDVTEGQSLVAYYNRKITASAKVSNLSETYSETLELYVDALAKDKCQNIYRVQFYIPYAQFTGNFELAMGDSQTVHNFEATSIASACGGESLFWDLIVFGENAADAE